mgnify:CR=1 FL=1
MDVPRISSRLLLGPNDLPASNDAFEVIGAFNPGAVRLDDEVVLLVRVVERPRERRRGHTGLPRWDEEGGLQVDWVPNEGLDMVDPRVVRRKADGLVRLTFVSHLRVVRCGDGRGVRQITNIAFRPEGRYEEFGVEDARITTIKGRHYFTYVAVSRHGVATALASTADFRSFERHGLIFCPENKDVVLFPEEVRGKFAALHRPVGGQAFCRPEIWFASSNDLLDWGGHKVVNLGDEDWQSGRVGAGTPPIEVEGGWLVLYHGNRRPTQPGEVGAYFGAALLLDREAPFDVLRRSSGPFLVPEMAFEVNGFVPNVVFPTGLVRDEGKLLVYYGAADTATGVAEFSERGLLESLAV